MDKGLLPVGRANMLRGWVHSGFNVHRSRRVLPDEREDLERLAQYIIRNPFAVEKMQVSPPNQANPDGLIIYRSELNPKIQRNFEVFTPCDFIAAITQHIPDKSFQLVRYYGWYSNKMRGQRAAEEAAAAGQVVRVSPARAPPEIAEWVIEPCCDDPFPCLPRRSEAKTGLRHRTGDDVRERLSARGRGDLFCRQASGPVAVHLDASTPLRLPSRP